MIILLGLLALIFFPHLVIMGLMLYFALLLIATVASVLF